MFFCGPCSKIFSTSGSFYKRVPILASVKMINIFKESRLYKGRVVVGERSQWRSIDGDNLYILETVPIYWSEMNTPVNRIRDHTPPRPRQKRLTDRFGEICLEKDIPRLHFDK